MGQDVDAVQEGGGREDQPGLDEALALPTDFSARIARNTQLILQEETGITHVVDPLAGSYYIESLTAQLAEKAWAIIEEIEEMGGMTKAVATGQPKLRIEETAARRQAMIDRGEEVIVGVNRYRKDREDPIDILDIDNVKVRASQIARLETIRATRDKAACDAALAEMTRRAREGGNLLEAAVEAARARATVGEISMAMEDVFGRHRAEINPLRVLDDKRPEVQELTADAPLMLDYLSPQAREHFEAVTGCLDDLGVTYVINPRMVRGLDYYTKTCFEFVHDGLGAQSGIGGGGRYDGLMRQLGGRDLSGIGFGLGVDRTMLALEAEGVAGTEAARCQVFGVPLGTAAKAELVGVAGQLRAAGISVDLAYGDRGLKGAMKAADRSGAKIALVLGDREIEQRVVEVKNLTDGVQQQVCIDDVVGQVQRLLG